MTQRLNILFCLFLAACSANETKETIDPVLDASKEQSLISNAILLKHSPVISTYGITFPSN